MAAYSFRRTGTKVSSSSSAAISPTPGTFNSDYFAGDLLVLPTVNRADAQSAAALTGWGQAYVQTAQKSIEVWARIADGSANDTPSVDWSGTSRSVAWIDSFYGDVQTTIASLLHASSVVVGGASNDLQLPTLEAIANGFTLNDCLLYAVGVKATTAAGDTTAVLAPTGMTLAGEYISNTASGLVVGSAYVQQTSQTDWPGTDFALTDTTPESLSYAGIVLAFTTLVAAAGNASRASYHRMLRNA